MSAHEKLEHQLRASVRLVAAGRGRRFGGARGHGPGVSLG